MPMSPEEFAEAQYNKRLTIGWDYAPPAPDQSACLEDARKLAQMLSAADHFGALRHIEASVGRVAAKTKQTAIDNGLLPPVILTATRSWMRKGVHRNVYSRQDGYESVPIEFPVA
jgi:hypothetical protein